MANSLRIAITGSSGFIGSYLTSHFDKLSIDYYPIKSRLQNINALRNEFNSLSEFDLIFHLSGTFYGNSDELYMNNYLATQNLLSVLTTKKTKIIYTSSGSVYGNSGPNGVKEIAKCNPVDDYGKIKLECEQIIQEYGNYLIMRLPSVYGKNNNKGVIFNWINALKSNHKLKVGNDGSSLRSFLCVKDLIEIMEILMYKDISGIYNLAENKSYSMIELALLLVNNDNSKIDFIKSQNKLESMVLDNNKILSEISFKFLNLKKYISEI